MMSIAVDFQNNNKMTAGYRVSIIDSVLRILKTRLGERVMRPDFGSDLYKLRDRNFGGQWRILATRYIFDAINKFEPRIEFKKLNFIANAKGEVDFKIEVAYV